MGHHHHHHEHKKQDFNKAFAIAILLNSAFILAEIIYGLQANSLSLLADAGHNAGDVLGLILAWGAILLAKRKASERFTYGLQSATIMASLINAIILLVAIGGISWEAIVRLQNPAAEINTQVVILIASFGILINGTTALLFVSGSKNDLNIRSAFLHMGADALVSLGVVISAFAIAKSGHMIIDPIVTLIIAVIIIVSTGKLLIDSIKLSLHAVPESINYSEVKSYLANLKNVNEVHDLHIWAMSTSDIALSVHLRMGCVPEHHFLKEIEHHLDHHFGITHPTIQIETGDSADQCEIISKHQH